MTALEYAAYFLPLITILVFVHELGHYWVARRAGVRVQVFSVGFGRELFGFTDSHGTRWKFSLIPLGGYVRMFGEHALEEVLHDPKEDRPQPARRQMTSDERAVSFDHKSLGARAAIVFAGPAINFVFAAILFAGLALAVGKPVPPDFARDGIGAVVAGSPADRAGLEAGDRIVAADGRLIESFEDLRQAVQDSAGAPIALQILRGEPGERLNVTVSPEARGDGYVLGVQSPPGARERAGVAESAWTGVSETARVTVLTLQSVGEMIVGARGTEELGGPVRIVQLSRDIGSAGWENYILLMAILSVNLGLINLFPIPMLDGGHLMFYAIEAVRGRPLSERAQEMGFRVGLAMILTLMIFLTFNDFLNMGL